MAIRRFHCPNLDTADVQLEPDDARHARRVLRLDVGDAVELFDGAGAVATGRLESWKPHATVRIESVTRHDRPVPQVDLAVAMPKGARADTLVEKASELGVDRLIPLLTDRSVVDPGKGKQKRLGRIAIESAKQCGRAWLLQLDSPIAFGRLVEQADHDLKLIADVPGGSAAVQPLQSDEPGPPMLSGYVDPGDRQRVLVLIGPEGGWTDAERNAARTHGFAPWCFGPHVMRVETAALAAAALLRAHTQPQ